MPSIKFDLMTILIVFVIIGVATTIFTGIANNHADSQGLNRASQALMGQQKVIVSDYYKDGYYERLANMPDPKVYTP